MNTEREDILEDEFVRAKAPGLREFTVGILKLARKLDVGAALPKHAKTPEHDTPERVERDMTVITWLLDERHSLQQIREAADAGRPALDPSMVEYEFDLAPALFKAAEMELARANRALGKLSFKVAPKPGGSDGPQPPGNS